MRIILRLIGLAIGLALGFTAGDLLADLGDTGNARGTLVLLALSIGGLGYVLGPHLSWAIFHNLSRAIASASVVDLLALGAGLTLGAVLSALLAVPLSFLPDPLGLFLPFVAAILLCLTTTTVTFVRRRDLLAPLTRSRLAKHQSPPSAGGTDAPSQPNRILLDTNIAIDGRIPDLVRTGFIDGTILVPRFVLDELQRVADSGDHLRRARGRRGLDTLNRLRQEFPDRIEVLDAAVPEERDVDAKLIRLAQECGAKILTNDYNLNRVAQFQNVTVLNLNELTNALRPIVLPGEEIQLKVVQEGREAGQGIGFLDDGTMVVIDGGKQLVGSEAHVTVTRLLQTGAGRMVFATPKHGDS
ncbi:MAG TPA: PIN domain-containing protein [Thermomicrobiales bacterium]|mgnify:FL=1